MKVAIRVDSEEDVWLLYLVMHIKTTLNDWSKVDWAIKRQENILGVIRLKTYKLICG